MPRPAQFAWTGPLPDTGYVGYVNVTVEEDGVLFTVRSEGAGATSSYKIPRDVAAVLLRGAADAVEG